MLRVGNSKKTKINKTKAKFNTKVKRLEALKMKVEQQKEQLGRIRTFLKTEVRTHDEEIYKKQAELLDRYIYFHDVKNKNFAKWQMDFMLDEIIATAEHLASNNYEREKFIKIYDHYYEGDSFDEQAEEETAYLKEKMQNEIKEATGIDVNLDDYDIEKEEDLARFLNDFMSIAQEKNQEEEFAERNKENKSKAQIKEEKKYESMDAEIGKIYKRLAVAHHPDKFSDPKVKEEKEEILKSITTLRKEKDLYGLIAKDIELRKADAQDDLDKTDAKTFRLYNQVLDEQIEGLEASSEMFAHTPELIHLHGLREALLSGENRLVDEEMEALLNEKKRVSDSHDMALHMTKTKTGIKKFLTETRDAQYQNYLQQALLEANPFLFDDDIDFF